MPFHCFGAEASLSLAGSHPRPRNTRAERWAERGADPTFDDIELREQESERAERGRDVQNIASAAHASLLFENTEVLT
jgi:hypothetical protein